VAGFGVSDPKKNKPAPAGGKNRFPLLNNHFAPLQRGFLPNHKAAGPKVHAASLKDIFPCIKALLAS
jgi:hypothetical protein